MKVEKIGKAEVLHVAQLARLEFNDEEVEEFTHHLNRILEYVDQLKELDTQGIDPTFHVLAQTNVMRGDEVGPSLSQEDALGNAPDKDDRGFFRVPRIIQG